MEDKNEIIFMEFNGKTNYGSINIIFRRYYFSVTFFNLYPSLFIIFVLSFC